MHNISPAVTAHGRQKRECGEIEEETRTEHLQGLPDGLLVEHGVVRIAVFDTLEVLVLGPEGVAGTLGAK